eukprot:6480012-Amphidinium_carterae.1
MATLKKSGKVGPWRAWIRWHSFMCLGKPDLKQLALSYKHGKLHNTTTYKQVVKLSEATLLLAKTCPLQKC